MLHVAGLTTFEEARGVHRGPSPSHGPSVTWPVSCHRLCTALLRRHGDFHLIESPAIANYVDAVFADHGAALRPPRSDARASARVDEMASFAASYVFPAVEVGIVKPRLKLQKVRSHSLSTSLTIQARLDQLQPDQVLRQSHRPSSHVAKQTYCTTA